jgi:hypothetical protein
MTTLSISPPFPIFSDRDGSPLENGYIWVGTANVNPITNPIAVYWDAALTQPAALPVRTINGYPANSGTPGRLFTGSADYSLTVQDSKGSLVYSALTSTDGINQYATLAQLAASSGSSLIGFEQANVNAVARTVESKLQDVVSFTDFGADPTGVDDSTVAMQNAINAVAKWAGTTGYERPGSGVVTSPPGATYRITAPLLLRNGVGIDLNGSTIVQHTNNTQIIKAPTGAIAYNWALRNGYLRYATFQDGTCTIGVTGTLNAGDVFQGNTSGAVGKVVSVAGGVMTYLAGNGVLLSGEQLIVDALFPASTTTAPTAVKTGSAIQLADGAFSFQFVIENLNIEEAFDAIFCPATSASFAFVGELTNVFVAVARWAINYDCDSNNGANTNVVLTNCWHNNYRRENAPFASGFRFNACAMFRWNSVLADGIQDQFLFMQTSSGEVGTISLEAANVTAYANSGASPIQLSNCDVSIGVAKFVGNAFRTYVSMNVTITGAIAVNDIIVDGATGASGKVVRVSGNRVTFTQNTLNVDFANGNSVLVGGVSQGTVNGAPSNSGVLNMLRATSSVRYRQFSAQVDSFLTSGNTYAGKDIYEVSPTADSASPVSGPYLIYNTDADLDRINAGFNITGTIAVGNTIIGATSGASGVVTAVGTFRVEYNPNNDIPWTVGENVQVGGVTQATALGNSLYPGSLADFTTPPSVRLWNGVSRTVVPDPTYAASPGYLGLPQTARSAAYQLAFSDAGKSIVHPITDNNARTFTIPANTETPFPVGTEIVFVNMINTVTIAITTDTMYLSPGGTTGSRTLAAFGRASAIKVTSTSWVISGSGLT